MALDDEGGVLQDSPVEGVAVKFLRLQEEIGEGGAGVLPINEIHHVAEAALHPVAPGGVPVVKEATALGAAILAGCGVGIYKSEQISFSSVPAER